MRLVAGTVVRILPLAYTPLLVLQLANSNTILVIDQQNSAVCGDTTEKTSTLLVHNIREPDIYVVQHGQIYNLEGLLTPFMTLRMNQVAYLYGDNCFDVGEKAFRPRPCHTGCQSDAEH